MASDCHELLHDVASTFDALAMKLDRAIDALGADESGTVNLAALARARDAAKRGASFARNATSDVRRAFD